MSGDVGSRRVVVDQQALVRPLPDEEAVVLHLQTEIYFGLNATGLRMWNALTTATSVNSAIESMLNEFHVDESHLRTDVEAFIDDLTDRGLVRLEDSA